MEQFAFNGSTILLDDRLREFERIAVTPEFIIYNQFLSHLHLPSEKWAYEKDYRGSVLIEKNIELEEMDTVLFKELDYFKLVSPLHLYTYYLLQQYLGNGQNFHGLGILRASKSRFVYLDAPFSIDSMKKHSFETNSLSRLLIKRAKKADLVSVHETFFVLLDQKFKTKLLNALTFYQSETGNEVAKIEMIDIVLNMERLKALKSFSKHQLERL